MRVAKAPTEKMYRLRSTCRQIYSNQSLMPGDEFPDLVPERVAVQLIRMHFATDAADDIDVQRPKRAYRRRDMKAES